MKQVQHNQDVWLYLVSLMLLSAIRISNRTNVAWDEHVRVEKGGQSDQSRARVYIFTKIKPLHQRDMKRTNTQCVWASSAFVRLEKISCINKVWPVWSWDGKWAKSLTAQVQKTSWCHGSNIKRHVLTVKGPIKVLFGRWFVFFLPAAALLVFNSLRARREYKQNHPTSVNLRSCF